MRLQSAIFTLGDTLFTPDGAAREGLDKALSLFKMEGVWLGAVTALNPIIGYKNSTKIAREALETGRGVYELVLEHGILSREELDEVLKPENMIRPVKLNIRPRR